MAVIGSATLNIVPKVQGGLANAINGELGKANLAGIGKSAGSSFMGGITNGAAFGLWSSVASRAIDAVTSSLGSAASRVDTLNNYPRVMEQLGVKSEVAEASIQTMSDALSNVPTRLDDMASATQGIFAASLDYFDDYNEGLRVSTDAGLALNSMLLSGGKSTAVANAAMEQFQQILAKGKPELQDWRSLIQAAPTSMHELAEEMLGAGHSAMDLYYALGGGKEADAPLDVAWKSIGVDEFLLKLASMKDRFAATAEEAQGGIGTSFANMRNAVTKGVANVLDAFGQERIASAIGDVKGMINDVFGRDDTEGLRAFATEVAPMVSGAWDSMVKGVGDFSSRVGPSVESVGRTLVDFAQDVGPSVGDAMSTVGDVLADLAPTFATSFDGVARTVGDVVKDVAGAVSDAAPALGAFAKEVVPAVADVASALAPALPAIVTAKAVFGGLSGMAGGLTMAGTAISGVGRAFGAVGSVLPMIGSLSDVPAALGLLAESGGGVAAALNPVPLLVGAAAVGIGALGVKTYTTWKREQDFQGALRGVGDAVSGMTDGLLDGARDVTDYGEANQRAKADIDGLVQAMEDYATKTGRIHDSAQEQIGMLGQYKTVIDEAARTTAEGGELSADGMAKLEWALRGLNEMTGSDYQVTDIVNPEEPEKIRDTVAAIDELIAKRQQEARTTALQDTLTESYKLQQEAATELSRAQNDAANAQQDWNEKYDYYVSQGYDERMAKAYADQAVNLSDYQDALGKATGAYNEATAAVERNEQALGMAATATSESSGELANWFATNQLASASLADTVTNTDAFYQAMENAGIGAERLSEIGEYAFSDIANSCNGSVDDMVTAIALYNEAPIIDKDGEVRITDTTLVDAEGHVMRWNAETGQVEDKEGNVAVDDTKLIDAYGNVVTWNSASLTDKDGRAIVEDAKLTDAQGRVYTWNGTTLRDKSGRVVTEDKQLRDTHRNVVNYNALSITSKRAVVTTSEGGLSGLISRVRDFMNLPSSISKSATYTTRNVTVNETRTLSSPAHGKNGTMAHGGHAVPRNAAGYIAAGPTLTSFGLVGEDGIEAVYNNGDGSSDVYPLNNPRYLGYADPLADRIARGIAKYMPASDGKGMPNVVINGVSGPDEVARAVTRMLTLMN